MTTNAPHTGALIRVQRELAGRTVDEIAAKAEIRATSLYRIERTGSVNNGVLRRIVAAIGCKIQHVTPEAPKHAKPTRKAAR